MQYTSLSLTYPADTTQCLNFFESSALIALSSPVFKSAEPLQVVQDFLSDDM